VGNVSKADSLNRQALIAFSFSTHSQKGNMKKVPIEIKVMIPFVMTGIAGMTAPILLSGGHNLIMSLPTSNYGLDLLFAMLILKFILTQI